MDNPPRKSWKHWAEDIINFISVVIFLMLLAGILIRIIFWAVYL